MIEELAKRSFYVQEGIDQQWRLQNVLENCGDRKSLRFFPSLNKRSERKGLSKLLGLSRWKGRELLACYPLVGLIQARPK